MQGQYSLGKVKGDKPAVIYSYKNIQSQINLVFLALQNLISLILVPFVKKIILIDNKIVKNLIAEFLKFFHVTWIMDYNLYWYLKSIYTGSDPDAAKKIRISSTGLNNNLT